MGGVRCRYSLLGNKLARFLSTAVAVRTPSLLCGGTVRFDKGGERGNDI